MKFFNVAKSVSELSDFYKSHTGCIVVYHKSILSTGYNQNKTHTDQRVYNAYRFKEAPGTKHCVHAEVDALSKIKHMGIDWHKTKIYVYREHKLNKTPMLAKPCPSCMAYLRALGIRNIYYSDYDGYSFLKLAQ